MSDKTTVCNRALQLLGAKRVVTLTEDSENARACNLAYDEVRRAELRAHTWSFAVKRASLAAKVPVPIFGRTNAFPLPADWLRLLPKDPRENIDEPDWQIEGQEILTDDDAPLEIRYIFDIEDVNAMDALFRETLSAAIAMNISEDVTHSNSKVDRAAESYKVSIARAKRTNAIERVSAVAPQDTWLEVRRASAVAGLGTDD